MSQESLYSPAFVADLFTRMSTSYTAMNSITSLGFYPYWRKVAVKALELKKGQAVADLLAGPGDSWKYILPHIGKEGTLTALDFSSGMIAQAEKRKEKYPGYQIDIREENIFTSGIPDNSQDAVVCCYGLKTFSREQIADLASEILRILKPEGRYSLVDVAMPKYRLLRHGYLFYLKQVIPFISKNCVQNADTYSYLSVYSDRFEGFDLMRELLKEGHGNPVEKDLTLGCAKLICGMRS